MQTPPRRGHRARRRAQRGATAVEYGLVLAALVLGSIPVLNGIEREETDEYEYVSTQIGQTYYDDIPAPPAPSTGGGDAFVATLLPGDDLTEVGDFNSNAGFFAAFETGPITLEEVLVVDTGTIPIGANVCSHLMHSSAASGTVTVNDTLEFPGDVFGWLATDVGLDATDEQFGVPGVVYWTGQPTRGIEEDPLSAYDSVIQLAPNEVAVSLSTSDVEIDQIRVFWDCTDLL